MLVVPDPRQQLEGRSNFKHQQTPWWPGYLRMDLPQLLQQDLLRQKPDPCCSTTIQSLQQHAVDEFSNTSETSVVDVDELHAISAWKILSVVGMSIIREIARKKRSVQKSTKKSEVAVFGQWVPGANRDAKRFLLCWLTSSQIWLLVDNRQSTYLKKLEKQKTPVTIKVRSCEVWCFQNQNPKDGVFTPKDTGAKNQVKSRRVEGPVIVHFKNLAISCDLSCLWGPKMDCTGGLGGPNALYIVQFGLQTQKLWALQGLGLIAPKKKKVIKH